MDDADFLAAIRAAPDDPAPRLIFADFLDERADPRADLIRHEEEMRESPAFGDHYWNLKGERDRLKSAASAEWLAAMGYDLPQPVFAHGWPDDWRGRWRLIRLFAENWYGVSLPDVGGRRDGVRGIELDLEHDLPESLREWAAFEADMADESERWDRLRFEASPADGAVRLVRSNSPDDDVCRAVRVADFTADDPPLCEMHRMYRSATSAWLWDDEIRVGRDPVSRLASEAAFARLLEVEIITPHQFAVIDYDRHWNESVVDELGSACQVGDFRLAERPGMVYALILAGNMPAFNFRFAAAAGMPRERVPDAVWEMCSGYGAFRGMFLDEHERRGGEVF